MYSMPQHAVTNGYWKNDQRRPQFTTSCTVSFLLSRRRKKPSASFTVVGIASVPSVFSMLMSVLLGVDAVGAQAAGRGAQSHSRAPFFQT